MRKEKRILSDDEKNYLRDKINTNKDIIVLEKSKYDREIITYEEYQKGVSHYQREIDLWQDEIDNGTTADMIYY